jgi:hypothetical protein
MDFNERLNSNWSDRRKGFQPCFAPAGRPITLQLVQQEVYSYELIQSLDGKYLLFCDDTNSSLFSGESTCAVFEIEDSHPIRAICVNTIKDGTSAPLQRNSWHFHPFLPLLFAVTETGAGGPQILFWNFLKGMSTLSSIVRSVLILFLSQKESGMAFTICKNHGIQHVQGR